MIAVVGVTRSPLTAIGLRAGEPQLLDDRPDVVRSDEVVRLARRPAGPGICESSSWRTIAGPGRAGSGRPRSAPPRAASLSWRTRSADPAPWPSTPWISARSCEDPVLELVLLGLELGGRLHERRPLLGRVADARALRAELGGDQEAEDEQGHAERDLPARDAREAGRWPSPGAGVRSSAWRRTTRHRADDRARSRR